MVIDPFVNQFIDNLLSQYPKKWAKFLYHYSDVPNIVSILKSGILYSRTYSQDNGLLLTDCAGQEVLNHTPNIYKDHVRLYFRPRTPPFYHKEGFCQNKNISNTYQAHCPVPIYLIFNAKIILSNPNVQFSDGNLSSDSHLYTKKTDLAKLEFDKIYHDTYFTQAQASYKREIINKRCAEVIIPNQLKIDNVLDYIICRSEAERETLRNLLDNVTLKKYSNKIICYRPYFNCNKHFVNNVNLQSEDIIIDYNNSRLSPFEYKFTFMVDKKILERKKNNPIQKWTLTNQSGDYSFSIHIDDHIAYLGHFKTN